MAGDGRAAVDLGIIGMGGEDEQVEALLLRLYLSYTDREAADVVCAIISLAKALRLPVIAEGVETERQAVLLAAAGCSFLQGWHYGRPMSPEIIEKRLLGMKEMAG